MAVVTQGGTAASLARAWYLAYFGFVGLVPAVIFLGLAIFEGTNRNGSLAFGLGLMLYCIPNIAAFVGVLKRVSWALVFAGMVVGFDLIMHSLIIFPSIRAHSDFGQKLLLLIFPIVSLILLAVPSVRTALGSRLRRA